VKVTRRLRERLGEQLAPAARDLANEARERLAERMGDRLGNRVAERLEPGPSAPDAPGNRPRTAFAGVLDGRHLWLAVDATPGTLALRHTGADGDSRKVLPLTSDLAEDDPRYRSVRSDLAAVPGDGAARFEVVITAPGGKVHRVWTPPLVRGEPVRVPAVAGVQWQVARATDGTLELVREPAPPGAVLHSIDIDADDVATLRIAAAPAGAELRLVDDESGEVAATLPLTQAGGLATAAIAPGDVPGGVGFSASVHAGELPVRRRVADLARPDHAVLLPQVQNEPGDDGDPAFSYVFRWLPDGVLRVRRPKPRATGGPA
jgi:hypothetical protein